jgi:septal ring factor EnvC (AmiA/AmiB activator)
MVWLSRCRGPPTARHFFQQTYTQGVTMSFDDDELRGFSESHAPAAGSDDVRLELAREAVSKLHKKIEQLTSDVSRLETDLNASRISFTDFERTSADLAKALANARKTLTMYEMHERRMNQIFSNT